MNGNQFLLTIAVSGVLLFGAFCGIGAWADIAMCKDVLASMKLPFSWGPLQGCVIRTQGHTIYLKYYRFIRMKPA